MGPDPTPTAGTNINMCGRTGGPQLNTYHESELAAVRSLASTFWRQGDSRHFSMEEICMSAKATCMSLIANLKICESEVSAMRDE